MALTTSLIPAVSRRAGFVTAAAAFVLVFAASGAPIPLYELYRTENGIAAGDLAFGAVGYFAGTLFALLFLGRLSDHLGRKPIMLASLVFAVAGCVAMALVHDVPSLLGARLLQGLASGLAASGLGAYIIDTAPARPIWLPTMITGSGPMLGIPLGALLSGVLVETAPAPRSLVFIVLIVLLAVCAVILLVAPASPTRSRGAVRSLVPRLSVPVGAGRLLLAVSAAFVATWCFGGLYQAFAPTLAADELGSDNAVVAAVVFASIMVLAPLGGPIAGRLGPRRAVRLGVAVFTLAVAAALVSLIAGSIVPFLIASAVGGITQGVIATGGNRALLARTPPTQRGAMLSTIYVISYCGAAIPALVASRITGILSLSELFAGYVALTALAALVALITYPRPTLKERS